MASYNPDFSRKYLITNEVLNAVTHGIATLLSIVGLFFLIEKGMDSGSTVELTSYIVYGSSLILLYLSSTIYHSFKFTKASNVLRRLDHCSIFLLIAGTYTPYTLVSVSGSFGTFLTVMIWSIALFGVLYKVFWFDKFQNLTVWLYIAMGWIVVLFLPSIFESVSATGLLWLFFGGMAFTVGTIFYQLKKVRYMHVVWHIFVILGTVFMYISIYNYV